MPEPDRPDSSFFWLSNPWKAAVHIFWKNYKWWIITFILLALSALFIYLFFAEAIEQSGIAYTVANNTYISFYKSFDNYDPDDTQFAIHPIPKSFSINKNTQGKKKTQRRDHVPGPM